LEDRIDGPDDLLLLGRAADGSRGFEALRICGALLAVADRRVSFADLREDTRDKGLELRELGRCPVRVPALCQPEVGVSRLLGSRVSADAQDLEVSLAVDRGGARLDLGAPRGDIRGTRLGAGRGRGALASGGRSSLSGRGRGSFGLTAACSRALHWL